MVLDRENRVLLFRFSFDEGALAGKVYWATPGGALEPGESFEDAAQRELKEETGITAPISRQMHQKTAMFRIPNGEYVEADERYFLVRVVDTKVDETGQNPVEARYMKKFRWWTLEELEATSQTVFPEELAEMIKTRLSA